MKHSSLARSALFAGACGLCGCQQLFDAFTATIQGVSVITKTPDLANAEGLTSTQLRDALPLDALAANATGVVVGIGSRTEPLSTEAPTPISDAEVSIAWDSNSVDLCAGAEAGTYLASSLPGDPCAAGAALTYVPSSSYTTTMLVQGNTLTAQVTAPGALAAADVDFSPAFSTASSHFGANLPAHAANTDLTVDWSSAAAAGSPVFVTVFRIRYTGGSGASDALNAANWQADQQPVFDSLSRDPAALIGLVLLDQAPTNVTVPQGTFSATGVYLIVVTSTELNPGGTGLALGSGAMAGTGTAFIVWVE